MRALHLNDLADVKHDGQRGRSLLTRLGRGLAGWMAQLRDEPEVDPTAHFSSRDWADLPVYHPARDDGR